MTCGYTRYVRIELCYEDEPQECGLFQALDETEMSEGQYEGYMDYFTRELLKPVLTGPCWFFFTEEGIYKFLPVLSDILLDIELGGWGFYLIMLETDVPPIYEDNEQVAWEYDRNNVPAFETHTVYFPEDLEEAINLWYNRKEI